MGGTRTLRGVVRLAEPLTTLGALLIVRVEDVGRADAPATTVAEQRQEVTGPVEAHRPIAFVVALPECDPHAMLAVRVHVSLRGGDQIEEGDRISTQSHPVPAVGPAEDVDIVAHRI